MNDRTRWQIIAAGLTGAILLIIAVPGLADKISLNPIKPGAKQTAPMTDEQQGIWAVRTVKPAVVDILGVSTSTAVNLGSSVTSLQSQPQGDKGTGFIIRSDGLIVTNDHVVDDPNFAYTVMFADGSKYSATILGHDKYDDVALLKITAQNLPTVKFGNSDALETGQTVFAIGNTLGRYQNTVSKGVISGLGRSLDSTDDSGNLQLRRQRMIQTDAAISPGNSGGPLIDLAGEVVGMNTLIDTEGESLTFAVPANVIKDVVEQLQTFGKTSRAYLGVKFITLSGLFLLPTSSPVSEGAYVSEVAPGSPASLAGLAKGDIITAVNHKALNELNELDGVLAQYSAGSQVLITYVRGGQTNDTTVILGNYQ